MAHAIKQAVELRGGRCWFARDSRGQNLTDMLDLLILLPPYVMLVELKSQRRKLTVGQAGTLQMAEECTRVLAAVVRPRPDFAEIGYDAFLEFIAGVGKEVAA